MTHTTGIEEIDRLAIEMEFDPEQIAQVLGARVETVEDPEIVRALGEERAKNTRQIFLYDSHFSIGACLILDLIDRHVNFSLEVPVEVARLNVFRPSPNLVLIKPTNGTTVLRDVPFSFIGLPAVTMVKARPEHQRVFFISERRCCFIVLEVQGDCRHKVYIKDKNLA